MLIDDHDNMNWYNIYAHTPTRQISNTMNSSSNNGSNSHINLSNKNNNVRNDNYNNNNNSNSSSDDNNNTHHHHHQSNSINTNRDENTNILKSLHFPDMRYIEKHHHNEKFRTVFEEPVTHHRLSLPPNVLIPHKTNRTHTKKNHAIAHDRRQDANCGEAHPVMMSSFSPISTLNYIKRHLNNSDTTCPHSDNNISYNSQTSHEHCRANTNANKHGQAQEHSTKNSTQNAIAPHDALTIGAKVTVEKGQTQTPTTSGTVRLQCGKKYRQQTSMSSSGQGQGYRGFIQETMDSLYPLPQTSACRDGVSSTCDVTTWGDKMATRRANVATDLESVSGQSELNSWNARDFTSTSTPRSKAIGPKQHLPSETPQRYGNTPFIVDAGFDHRQTVVSVVQSAKGNRMIVDTMKVYNRNDLENRNTLSDNRRSTLGKDVKLTQPCPTSAPEFSREIDDVTRKNHATPVNRFPPTRHALTNSVKRNNGLMWNYSRERGDNTPRIAPSRISCEQHERIRSSPNATVVNRWDSDGSGLSYSPSGNTIRTFKNASEFIGHDAKPGNFTRSTNQASSSPITSTYCNQPCLRRQSMGGKGFDDGVFNQGTAGTFRNMDLAKGIINKPDLHPPTSGTNSFYEDNVPKRVTHTPNLHRKSLGTLPFNEDNVMKRVINTPNLHRTSLGTHPFYNTDISMCQRAIGKNNISSPTLSLNPRITSKPQEFDRLQCADRKKRIIPRFNVHHIHQKNNVYKYNRCTNPIVSTLNRSNEDRCNKINEFGICLDDKEKNKADKEDEDVEFQPAEIFLQNIENEFDSKSENCVEWSNRTHYHQRHSLIPGRHSLIPGRHSLTPERHSLFPERHSLIPERRCRRQFDETSFPFSRRLSFPTWMYQKNCRNIPVKAHQSRMTQKMIREQLDHRRESLGYKQTQGKHRDDVLSSCKTTRQHIGKYDDSTQPVVIGNNVLRDIGESDNSSTFQFQSGLKKQNEILSPTSAGNNNNTVGRVSDTGHISQARSIDHIKESRTKTPSTSTCVHVDQEQQLKSPAAPILSACDGPRGTTKNILQRHASDETLSSGYRSLERCRGKPYQRTVPNQPNEAVERPVRFPIDGLGGVSVSKSWPSLEDEKEEVGKHCSEKRRVPGSMMQQDSRLQHPGASGPQPMDSTTTDTHPSPDPGLVPGNNIPPSHGPVHLDGSIKAYDNFFQELEKDFGQLPQFPSPHGPEHDRKGQRGHHSHGNAPYTSTLEHKHESNSSSDRYTDLHSKSHDPSHHDRNHDPSHHDRQNNKVLNERKPHGRTSFSSQSNCSSLRSDSHYSSPYNNSPAGRQNSFNSKSNPQSNNNNNNNNQAMSSPSQYRHGNKRENSPHTNTFQSKGNYHGRQESPQSSSINQHHQDSMPSSSVHLSHNNNINSNDNNNNFSNENSKNPGPSGLPRFPNNSSNSHGQTRHNHNSVKNIRSSTTHNTGDGFSSRSSHLFKSTADNAHISSNSDSEQADKTLQSEGVGKWPGKMDSEDIRNVQRWPESNYSYSDNEKQLLEEMRRMKKEHQNVLRTYEGRINKLMAKMHELRNIAEMLENSSTKSSPFGVLPGKLALLNILGEGGDDDSKKGTMGEGSSPQMGPRIPPPLPPRPARGSRVYPNKPIIHTNVTMKNLLWDRIILDGFNPPDVLWKDMVETEMDKEELERLFSGAEEVSPGTNLYEDVCQRRGSIQMQPTVRFYESEHSQRIHSELCNLKCNLQDVTKAFVMLSPGDLHIDSFAELLELLASNREIEKIIHHGKRKGTSQLDAPEFLVFELSKIDHFKERLEFLRFKNKLQINLFEIDQQLKELHMACDEISSSLPLKHVLEIVLAIGNYMNGGTDIGQADGYKIEILTSLKYLQDKTKRGNLLELIMKIYCQKFECDRDFGCPTHFHFPEPSNMRHAAQVSFDDIQRALKELKDELTFVMNKLENLSKRQTTITMGLRVTSENFFTSAVEVLAEEQKLLEDTKIHFAKTTAYFSHNEHPSSPKEFFQLWASFLHDCKYYWKLAHRNLARAKFTEDLAMKNQMSSSSLPGFNNLKSVMMKHVVSFQKEDDMDDSKAQQLQHISSWIESIGRYAMEIQPEGFPQGQEIVAESLLSQQQQQLQQQQPHNHQQQHANSHNQGQNFHSLQQQHHQQHNHRHHHPQQHSPPYVNSAMYQSERHNMRNQPDVVPPDHSTNTKDKPHYFDSQERRPTPSSPKPLSAVPPNVIKPQPISHTSPTISSPSPSSPSIHHPTNPTTFYPTQYKEESDANFGFSSPPLNLRPDLTPEVLIPDKSMEIQHPASPTGTSHSKKNQNFFKAFMKKDQTKASPQQSPENESGAPSKSKVVVTPFNKLKNTFVHKISGSGSSKRTETISTVESGHENPIMHDPYAQIPVSSSMGRRKDIKTNANTADYQNCQPQFVEEVPVLSDGNDDFTDRGESVASTASTINRYQDQVSSMYGFRSQMNNDLRKSLDQLNDMPDTNYQPSLTPDRNKTSSNHRSKKSGSTRQRAAIALGSNLSISDAFTNAGDSATPMNEEVVMEVNQFRPPKVAAVPSSPDPKLVRAEAVPVYKAKLIPNYENQTKLDPRIDFGIRGHAEAVRVPHLALTSETYKMEIQKQSERYVSGGGYSGYGQGPQGGRSSGANVPGAPTTYTVMPSKSNQYNTPPSHVSPFVVQHADHNTPPHGNQHYPKNGSKSAENYHSTENRDVNYNIEHKDNSTSSSRHGMRRRNNKASDNFQEGPQENDLMEAVPKVDSVKTQGRRSTSAHNLLSGNLRDSEQLESRLDEVSKGHVSRRDASEIKVTPTSRRAQSQGRSKPTSETVTSLIDRFEKKPLGEPDDIGMLDANEKPPSMTSTPVSRRKTFSAKTSSYDTNGNISGSNSDAGSQLSRSNRQEQRQDGQTNRTAKNLNDHFASFGSPSQIVTPINNAPYQQEMHNAMENHFQENQSSRNKDSKNPEAFHGSLQMQHSSQQGASSLDRGKQKQYASHNFQDSPMDHRQDNTPGHSVSPACYSSASRTPDRTASNQGRSSSSQRSVHSSVHSGNHRHRHTTPSSSLNFLSPYLPKPEPQYPMTSQGHVHVAVSQQNLNSIVPNKSAPVLVHSKNHSNHHPHHHSKQDHSSYSNLAQAQADKPPQQQSIQQQQHLQETPQSYHSWPSTSSSSISQQPQHRSRRDLDVVPNDPGNYTQQLRKAYNSNTSAFERPLKPSYNQASGEQKSNTAIVKPTVMHL